MPDFPTVVAAIRDAVCAILRVKQAQAQGQFEVAFVGSGWCINAGRYVVTAHHIFNDGIARNPADKFFVFVVPGNGPAAYHTPVVGVPFEDAAIDMAILEIVAPPNYQLSVIGVTFSSPPDGAHVLTFGFPSPSIVAANVDKQGNWLGGNLLLKGHANEGIVSAQYNLGSDYVYELNVGWHHGESGGPVLTLDPVAAFAMMQFYRNIQSPHGVVAGPHMGRALSQMKAALSAHGAIIV